MILMPGESYSRHLLCVERAGSIWNGGKARRLTTEPTGVDGSTELPERFGFA